MDMIDKAMVLFDLKAASTVRISVPYAETAGYAMVRMARIPSAHG